MSLSINKLVVIDMNIFIEKSISNNIIDQCIINTIQKYIHNNYKIILWISHNTFENCKIVRKYLDKLANNININISYMDIHNCAKENLLDLFWMSMDKTILYDTTSSFFTGNYKNLLLSQILNIDYIPPKYIFTCYNKPIIEHVIEKEVIIMCGLNPALIDHADTCIAKIFANKYNKTSLNQYEVLDMLESCEELNNKLPNNNMMNFAKEIIKTKSIIFNSSNSTICERLKFVNFAKDNNVNCRCVWLKMSLEEAIQKNTDLSFPCGQIIPNAIIYKMNNNFEIPTENEGFVICKFIICH